LQINTIVYIIQILYEQIVFLDYSSFSLLYRPMNSSIMLSAEALRSLTLEVKGFHKSVIEQEIVNILSIIEEPVEIDFLSRYSDRSKIYVTYGSMDIAMKVVHSLHQHHFRGSILSVRYELGVDEEGRRVVDRSSHNTLIRSVRSEREQQLVPDTVDAKTTPPNSYSFNSVTIDHTIYPFPSGLYMSRVLGLTRTLPVTDPLLDLLTDPGHCGRGASKQSKELSEVMAMADCTERAIKRVFGVAPAQLNNPQVDVYVVGDGKVPLGSACLCLHLPAHWCFHSIDPLLQPLPAEALGHYAHRFRQFRGRSQDFSLPQTCDECCVDNGGRSRSDGRSDDGGGEGDREEGGGAHAVALSEEEEEEAEERGAIAGEVHAKHAETTITTALSNRLSIVVACHSHAPLSEFWCRVPAPKIAIVMPCCANYSDLPTETPLLSFEDFEVYSPKRKISIYACSS
jgi:hypothetical protein